MNNFWREKHVNKCSIKTDEEIYIQNFKWTETNLRRESSIKTEKEIHINWTETDKHLSQNKDSKKNLAREDKYGKDKLQLTTHSHTEPLGKISTHSKQGYIFNTHAHLGGVQGIRMSNEDTLKIRKWRNFLWERWKWE